MPIKKTPAQKFRDRAYRNVDPTGYTRENLERFFAGNNTRRYLDPNTEGLWGKYTNQDSIIANYTQSPEGLPMGRAISADEAAAMGISKDRNIVGDLAKYAVKDIVIPSKSKDGAYELAYPNQKGNNPHLPYNLNDIPSSRWTKSISLGSYEQIKGQDENGSYVAYKDTWDINPFRGDSSKDDPSWGWLIKAGKKVGLDKVGDIVPFGMPFEVYGKQYYDKNGKPVNTKEHGGPLSKKTWNDLSMKERAAMMKVAVQNGITKLSDIKEKYNEFAEGGGISDKEYIDTMEKVAKDNWRKWEDPSEDAALTRIINSNAYDYRGYYNKYPESTANADTHWTDEFKLPAHESFSKESRYSGKVSDYNPRGLVGGHWSSDDDSKAMFIPMGWQAARANTYELGGTKKQRRTDTNNDPATKDWEHRREHTEVHPKYKRTEEDERYWQEKHRRNSEAAQKLNRSKDVVMSALEKQAKISSMQGFAEGVNEAAKNQRQKKIDKWHDYKKGIESTLTAAELLAAGYGLSRGALHLGRNWASRTGRTGLESTLNGWVNTWDKGQAAMNGVGATADYAQLATADNAFDRWENSIEAGAGTAGFIGATNWFRRTPLFGRYGNTIDNILDTAGYGAASWDVVKNLPPLSTYLDMGRQYYKDTESKEYSDGGPIVSAANIYGGDNPNGQQMKLGHRYWNEQESYHDWQNGTIDGGKLQEVTVTPTDDANWLFSAGRFRHNWRKPLADTHTRKVVSDYLSKFDNESAKDYNARISRLADVLDIREAQFVKNNVKSGKLKGRAHYNTNSDTGYVDTMQDIFAEVAHPWQYVKGNNQDRYEYATDYDSDSDPRGGTRYAYPDTFEGETHAFFEPALKEWVETGKIGKTSPIFSSKESKTKIVPKNLFEVLDSAASWDKRAIDNRIIVNYNQLPLVPFIKHNLLAFPLLEKKTNPSNQEALGGPLVVIANSK